jgi:tetratricopeptide (TPR) repeat protein
MIELARQMGDYTAGRKLGEENLAAVSTVFGAESPQVVAALSQIAAAAADDNDALAARDYLQRAVDISEKIAGPDSVATAQALAALAQQEGKLDHGERAEALAERALSIREQVLGPDHPAVATSLAILADIRLKRGRPDEALEPLRRSLALLVKAYGAEHPKVAIVLHKMGHIYMNKEDPASALTYYQRALEMRKKLLGPDHEMTLYSTMLVGDALAALHRCKEAKPILEAAAAGLEKKVGREHADWISTVAPRARCALAEGHAAEAVALLEPAIALQEGPNHRAIVRGDNRAILAKALWAVGKHREARAVAEKALEDYRPYHQVDANVRGVEVWLKAHP